MCFQNNDPRLQRHLHKAFLSIKKYNVTIMSWFGKLQPQLFVVYTYASAFMLRRRINRFTNVSLTYLVALSPIFLNLTNQYKTNSCTVWDNFNDNSEHWAYNRSMSFGYDKFKSKEDKSLQFFVVVVTHFNFCKISITACIQFSFFLLCVKFLLIC